jgi:hypothetical protein
VESGDRPPAPPSVGIGGPWDGLRRAQAVPDTAKRQKPDSIAFLRQKCDNDFPYGRKGLRGIWRPEVCDKSATTGRRERVQSIGIPGFLTAAQHPCKTFGKFCKKMLNILTKDMPHRPKPGGRCRKIHKEEYPHEESEEGSCSGAGHCHGHGLCRQRQRDRVQ